MDYDARQANSLTREQLRAMKQPVLGFCEHEDRMLPLVQAMFARSRTAAWSAMGGVGHWPHYEAPAQFNALALEFLSEASPMTALRLASASRVTSSTAPSQPRASAPFPSKGSRVP